MSCPDLIHPNVFGIFCVRTLVYILVVVRNSYSSIFRNIMAAVGFWLTIDDPREPDFMYLSFPGS